MIPLNSLIFIKKSDHCRLNLDNGNFNLEKFYTKSNKGYKYMVTTCSSSQLNVGRNFVWYISCLRQNSLITLMLFNCFFLHLVPRKTWIIIRYPLFSSEWVEWYIILKLFQSWVYWRSNIFLSVEKKLHGNLKVSSNLEIVTKTL